MDIKIEGVTEEIMEAALQQASEARLHILGEMNKVLAASRPTISDNAPAMVVLKVNPEKIRDIIGKGGSTIRAIVEQTGAQIDIDDDGSVRIYAADAAAKDAAVKRVMEIAADAEIGKVYRGRVERIVDFGAFVNILPGKDGLVHISQIADERVEKVTDYLERGAGSRRDRARRGPARPRQAQHEGSAERCERSRLTVQRDRRAGFGPADHSYGFSLDS